MKKINKFCAAAFLILGLPFFALSCRSLQQPEEVEKPLDYTNYDVVEAEIKRQREQEDSDESEVEVDWKDLVRANKKKKAKVQSNGFFDDL